MTLLPISIQRELPPVVCINTTVENGNVLLTMGSTLRRRVWGTLRLLRAWGNARCKKWNSFGEPKIWKKRCQSQYTCCMIENLETEFYRNIFGMIFCNSTLTIRELIFLKFVLKMEAVYSSETSVSYVPSNVHIVTIQRNWPHGSGYCIKVDIRRVRQ
jgi:hypothetical protein